MLLTGLRRALLAAAVACATMIVAAATPDARAATLVDTGFGGGPDWSFDSLGYYAGQFTLGSAYSITEIQASLSNTLHAGNLSAAILSDVGGLPGPSLHSQSHPMVVNFTPHWEVVTGLNWLLGAGTYWVALVPDASYFGNWRGGAPSPLAKYAFTNNSGGSWNAFPINVGVRIYGDQVTAVVPVPAALPLFACGLGLIGLLARKRRKPVA